MPSTETYRGGHEQERIPNQEYINEMHRRALLEQLPAELQERWEDAPVPKLEQIVETREKGGFKKIYGIHISPNEIQGSFINPDTEGKSHYTTNPLNLYKDKVGKWMYIVEGTVSDEWTDVNLGWKNSKSTLRIVERIPMDDEAAKIEALEKYKFIKPGQA
jgi:hypothetical protein